MLFLLPAFAFLFALMLVLGVADMASLLRYGDTQRTRQRLGTNSSAASDQAIVEIIRKDMMSREKPMLERVLDRVAPVEASRTLLRHAHSEMPVGLFLLLSVLLGASGLGLALYLAVPLTATVGLTVGLCVLPTAYMRRKKKKRLAAIEAQLPDALDLIARTLKAGHAFMMGLKMVQDQLEDPIAEEFGKAFEEINFGVSVGEAMKGLSSRIDSLDVKFFVTSLLVQLETGGNLAEIIQSISRLIRSRFELLGKVKALSAEGRISAVIMFSLPILLGIALYFINPDYIGLLFTDPTGWTMLTGGGIMMVFGLIVTRRMVNIKV